MRPNWLHRRVRQTPHRIGLRFGEEQWTFEQMEQNVLRYVTLLQTYGVREGTRIALYGQATPSFVFLIHASFYVGAEAVLLNRRLTAEELAFQIDDADVSLVVTDDVTPFESVSARVVSFTDRLPAERSVSYRTEWEAHEPATIMYTSGTTGRPKGVIQTYGNHEANALASLLNLGLAPSDSWLVTVPLFHISGLSILIRTVLYGTTLHLTPRFDEEESARLIALGRVTMMSVVTVTLERLVRVMERNGWVAHERFRLVLAGGGPIPPSLLDRAERVGIVALQTYGMTETSSQTATLAIEESKRKVGSAGKPLFWNDVMIDGADEPYTYGEICIRGPHVTPGYVGHASTIDAQRDGWFHTGDIGYFDEEGFLYVVDRRNDLIISGGENIYPAEIEHVLMRHEAVREAGVCGVPSEEWGEVPVAYVVLEEDVSLDILKRQCERHLAPYKRPKQIVVVDELPRNASNKLLRRELKTWGN
ncbi:MAG TPA: o-succinylbenzoate--CoA ligase [Savagea sp.]